MSEPDLRQLFRTYSNCYADTGEGGEVIQAITEDVFIDLMRKLNPRAPIDDVIKQ